MGAAFIFGVFSILIRAINDMFGVAAQSAIRFGVALLFLAIFNVVTRRFQKIPRGALMRIAFLGLSTAGLILLFTYSVNHTKISTSVCLQYAGTIVTSFILGTVVFKEKITVYKLAAISIAAVGLVCYTGINITLSLGMLAAFGSGIFDGISHSLRKSLSAYHLPRTLQLQYQFSFGVFAMTVVAFFSSGPIIKTVSLPAIAATLLFAALLICTGNLMLYGFQHFDVNVGAVILASEIFFASLLGYIFFRELPTGREAVGGLFIFIAATLSTIDPRVLLARWRPMSDSGRSPAL